MSANPVLCFSTVVLSFSMVIGCQPAPAFVPKPVTLDEFLSEKTASCSDWAVVANDLIRLGETKAHATLLAKAKSMEGRVMTGPDDMTAQLRLQCLCRVLFDPVPGKRIYGPGIGASELPVLSMPTADWPVAPMVEQDGVWFLMSESITLAGVSLPPSMYVDDCFAKGRFRASTFLTPTPAQATEALRRLFDSPRWKALKWSDSKPGMSYIYSPSTVESFLSKQVRY